MVHFSFSDDKIGMDIGNRPVLHRFDKRTHRAVITLADEDQFRAFAHIDARILVTVMNHAGSGCFDPASEASDTMADVSLRTYDLVGSCYGKIEIFDIGDDQFHRRFLFCDVFGQLVFHLRLLYHIRKSSVSIFFTNEPFPQKYDIIGQNLCSSIETKGAYAMDILEIMKARHSVRQYEGKEIESGIKEELAALVSACNKESGLNIQVLFNEPKCFDSMMAHYGKFSGVENYIALVGKKDAALDEKAGYYGERLVLKAQELGLNTCWVAMTHGKSAAEIKKGEKLACIIALGYGTTQGTAHQSKSMEQLCNCASGMPDWFSKGMEAALLAPTAMNQQKFYISLENGEVSARAGKGFYTKMDLGIVKYHFEAVTGRKVK